MKSFERADNLSEASMFVTDIVGLITDLSVIIPFVITTVAIILFSDSTLGAILAIVGITLWTASNRGGSIGPALLIPILVFFDNMIVAIIGTAYNIYQAWYGTKKHAKYFKKREKKGNRSLA